MIQHTPLAISLFLLSSYVIPGVSALLTPARVPQWVIGIVTPVLAAAGSIATEAQADPQFQWGHAGLLLLASLLAALVGYKLTFENELTGWLHKLWPGASRNLIEQAVETGVGYLVQVSDTVVAAQAAAPVAKPSPGPLVTGTLAPPQTLVAAPDTGTAPAATPVVPAPVTAAPDPAPAAAAPAPTA